MGTVEQQQHSPMEKVYFDTSAFNYLRDTTRWETFLNTRELQRLRGRELVVSPVTLWELMLAGDEATPDFLIYCAQHLFSERLLATPTELIVRYIDHAYPENVVNYDIYTSLSIGNIWRSMTTDPGVTLVYDKEQLFRRTQLLRKLSRNISSVLRYPDTRIEDDWLIGVAKVVDTYYSWLKENSLPLPELSDERDAGLLGKLIVLTTLVLFIFRLDFIPDVVAEFWDRIGLPEDDPTSMLVHFFQSYPDLLWRGPLVEIAMMAFNQVKRPGRTNRGLLLDSLHAVYLPYVSTMMTSDAGFLALREHDPHFARKLRDITSLRIREVPFISFERP